MIRIKYVQILFFHFFVLKHLFLSLFTISNERTDVTLDIVSGYYIISNDSRPPMYNETRASYGSFWRD